MLKISLPNQNIRAVGDLALREGRRFSTYVTVNFEFLFRVIMIFSKCVSSIYCRPRC